MNLTDDLRYALCIYALHVRIMNITLKIKDFSSEKLSAFIKTVEKTSDFKRLVHFSHDEKSHFDRFGYTSKEGKLSIVFDIKAKLLTLTACEIVIEKFKEKLELLQKLPLSNNDIIVSRETVLSDKEKSIIPIKNTANDKRNSQKINLKKSSPREVNESSAQQKTTRTVADRQNNPETTPLKKVFSHHDGQCDGVKIQNSNQPLSPQKSNTPKTEAVTPEYKNGFSLKNYPPEKLNAALEKIKNLKGVILRVDYATNDATAYAISDIKKNRIYLRYAPKPKSIQIQGKASDLFKEVQLIVYKGTDYKTAVSSYIQQKANEVEPAHVPVQQNQSQSNNSKKTNPQPPTLSSQSPKKQPTQSASNIEKKLKRLIPNAFDYLSEQSKKEFTFALIDIHNEMTRLSDYSGLLVSPYRGLERLIYDLQQAKEISVKMIGQAYEKKDDGSYTLKFGYRKKIDSIVYNEVMTALYSEYFEKRNFYLHSDNSLLGEHRRISEKSDAKKIFDNLLALIDYNCKKLKEINITIKK